MISSSVSCQLALPFCYANQVRSCTADQLIAEGTFVVTANTFGPQQVNVVLTNKKGYQKGQTWQQSCHFISIRYTYTALPSLTAVAHVQELLFLC